MSHLKLVGGEKHEGFTRTKKKKMWLWVNPATGKTSHAFNSTAELEYWMACNLSFFTDVPRAIITLKIGIIEIEVTE